MSKLNLQKILKDYQLEPPVIAEVLFPHNRCKIEALRRLIRENIPLDLEQLDSLAKYLGLSASQLLQYEYWEGSASEGRPVLFKGPFIVTIEEDGCYLKTVNNKVNRKIAEPNISIKELITNLDKLIKTWNPSKFLSI